MPQSCPMKTRWAVWIGTAALLMGGATLVPVSSAAAAVRPCSQGLVALTFDDGPAPVVTPRLLETLAHLRVQATFFLVGSHVAVSPGLARHVAAQGHVIANHSWDHPQLTGLSDGAIRWQLRSTRDALRRAGVRPGPLMRPPYGAINDRVRRIVQSMGMVPVLWDIDTRDWESGDSRAIADRVLGKLRPHRRNIVLQHDGVRRSPNSVAAVTRIVNVARARGYCFTTLDGRGRVAVPVPRVGVTVTPGNEAGRIPATVRLRLDRPTSRPTSIVLTTRSGTAHAGLDFVARHVTVRFPVGVRDAVVAVQVLDDVAVEPRESFFIALSSPRGLTVPRKEIKAMILSDDVAPPPPPSPPATPTTGQPLTATGTTD